MTIDETLQLSRIKERDSGRLLQAALSLKRYRQYYGLDILQASSAFYLPAVNSQARIKWG
jgi:hypothetical protein